ncbi:MAG: Gfo/Idh/MocA family oxidoreductase [Pirellulales bacterium]
MTPTRASNTAKREAVGPSRREFLKRSNAAVVGGSLATLAISRSAHAAGSDIVRLGLVGCGGRGRGAAVQALRAEQNARLVAVADAFEDQLDSALQAIGRNDDVGKRVEVDADHRFPGFDGFQNVIDSDVDVVLLATPPHFRPQHLRACIEAGKHVFAEKPVAVDAPGVRSVLETTALAQQKGLYILSGLNGRYSFKKQEAVRRVHQGAIGDIITLHSVRYAGGVWVRPREPNMTDMEYQMRNWYYFTWLSGDFNVEQFVHQLDACAWVMRDQYPVRCYATGGRQARTGDEYGHIYDHFSSVFEYDGGVRLFSTTRHQPNCSNESETYAFGSEGTLNLSSSRPRIEGKNPWQPSREQEADSHQLEHDAFFAALRDGRVINNGDYMAKSTMMAIMTRMSAYTGQTLTWEEAINSQEKLAPEAYTWDAKPPAAKVAVPGVTEFI